MLEVKVAHREENQWADFDLGNGVFFGLIDYKIIDKKRVRGNNAIPTFWADDVEIGEGDVSAERFGVYDV